MTDIDPRDEGGDPACWLDRVCPECGAVLEGDAVHHTWCGARRQPEDDDAG
jgi:hypothetical protein